MTPLRLSLHREIDNVADQAAAHASMNIVRSLAADLGTDHGDDLKSQRAAMLCLAGYIVAIVEAGDQAAAA